MATATSTSVVKRTMSVAEWLLKFIYEYLKRLITVNVPIKFLWMTDTYYPWAKGLVDHPTMYSGMNTKFVSCTKAVVAGIMAALAIGLVAVLLFTALVRSFWK